MTHRTVAAEGCRLDRCGIPLSLLADVNRAGQRLTFLRGAAARVGGRDADGRRGPLCGLPWPICPDDLGQRLGSSASTAWCPGLRPALARWMRSSRAPGRPRSGCGTLRAGSGRVPFPRRPSVRGAAGGDRRGPLMPGPAKVEHEGRGGLTPHGDPVALQGSAGRPRPRCGKILYGSMDLAWRTRQGQRPPQQVTWTRPITAPSAWFQARITSAVGSSSTWQRWRLK
jgi:hypothetical protein